jgi:hypothetical protein
MNRNDIKTAIESGKIALGSLGFAVVPPRYGGCFAQNRNSA